MLLHFSFVLFLAATALCAGVSDQSRLEKRQGKGKSKSKGKGKGISGLITAQYKGYGKVPDPEGAAPRKFVLKSPIQIPGIHRVKIRSGPYKVPNMGKASIDGHAGMLSNYPDKAIERPCSGSCVILWQQAGLEYANGSNANINSGMWLHHMVHFNIGPTRWDATGLGRLCLPHIPVGTSAKNGERYFTSGNERTPFNFNPGGTDLKSGSGYQLRPEDKFAYLVELMNMGMQDQVVYLTMTYDYLNGALPRGWKDVKTAWLDAAQCLTSEIHARSETGSYTLASKPWTPTYEGKILSVVGHLHDGGTVIDIDYDTNKTICSGSMKYSERPEYVFRGMSMGGDKVAKDHISSVQGCQGKDLKTKEMKKNQSWTVRGHYDYRKHDGNMEHGKQADVMVLSLVLVAVPNTPVPKPAT